MKPNYIFLEEATSTNTLLAAADATDPQPHATVLAARSQTAGRGQRGNSWEAEPGKNLTFSVLLRPGGVAARDQFVISEAVAIAVAHVVASVVGAGNDVAVKWPNDIYVGDRKICGILIENSLSGNSIVRSIAGVGLNVNQTEFVSDAPNPVSVAQLTGKSTDLRRLLEQVVEAIVRMADLCGTEAGAAEIHREYRSMLWRRNGMYRWVDAADSSVFDAEIDDIATTGHITLRTPAGELRTFAFKEVHPVI